MISQRPTLLAIPALTATAVIPCFPAVRRAALADVLLMTLALFRENNSKTEMQSLELDGWSHMVRLESSAVEHMLDGHVQCSLSLNARPRHARMHLLVLALLHLCKMHTSIEDLPSGRSSQAE